MAGTSNQIEKNQEQHDDAEPVITIEDDQDRGWGHFSLTPRINRSSFIALLWFVALFEVAAWFSPEYAPIILARTLTIQEDMFIQLCCHGAALILFLFIAAMRLRDINCSGSLAIVLFAPVVNLLLMLLLILLPGSKHWNRFGASPRSSGLLTRLLGVYMPLILIIAGGVAVYLHLPQVQVFLNQLPSEVEQLTGFQLSGLHLEQLNFFY